MSNRHASSITGKKQHFNISEIYLHPSHTKRKYPSNENTEGLSLDEQNSSKDIALLQITYLKNEKLYLKSMKAIQIQSIPNRRRVRQILNRGGKMISFYPQTNNANNTVSGIIAQIECEPNFNGLSGNLNFQCENQTVANDLYHRSISVGGKQVIEGFPLVTLFPKSRHRQSSVVVGCKTSKVSDV